VGSTDGREKEDTTGEDLKEEIVISLERK